MDMPLDRREVGSRGALAKATASLLTINAEIMRPVGEPGGS